MARIRKDLTLKTIPPVIVWRIGIYIRLSREDGNVISESVVNQLKIIKGEIPRIFKDEVYEIVDVYIDDGTSGTSDIERADFQRMSSDVRSGRINCVIVKNLSRGFRNSANQGTFLEEFLPLYNTRFISLYEPTIDTKLNPEVVHSLEVSITGFMNEQYAYKTSVDVRRTFKYKRENGEFIGAFAPYGYAKSPENKNLLIVDETAAQVVRDIFSWFVTEGMSKCGIARKLNELGIPNPTAYKRSLGFRYENPHAKGNDGLWNPTTVARILQDALYIGTLRQGKQKVISYKVHKRTSIPEHEWFVVENAVPPIVDKTIFQMAQELHQRDTRTAPGSGHLHLFSGLMRCADCGKAMCRTSAGKRIYYVCRTNRDKSTAVCTKHSVREDKLEQVVLLAIQKQIELVEGLDELIREINDAPIIHTESARLDTLICQNEKELAKAQNVLDSLYLDWKNGDISHEQYQRMKQSFEEKNAQLSAVIERFREERALYEQGINEEHPYLTMFLKHKNVQSLSRGLLVELVREIRVHENGDLDIEFNFADQYRHIVEFVENNQDALCNAGEKNAS